ncbi:MAG: redoxin family protein [Acidimicrobiia bacterium]|nr:redoxin family protein [Acidimicrobiia bacterium]
MIEVGSALPAVAVDVSGDGEFVSIADQLDRPTLLIVFKRSCPTTKIAMPVYQHWAGYGPEVAVIGVSQDSKEETAEFFDEVGVDLPVVYDPPPYALSASLDLQSVPSLLLVEDGVVTWRGEGWQTATAVSLAERLASIAGSEPILVGADDLPPWKPG